MIFSIGHSTRTILEFISLLQSAQVSLLCDVRRMPGSRRLPHFGGEQLASSLAAEGIAYRHMPELGGRRTPPRGAPPSRNTYWRIKAFQAYADYAQTPAFGVALDELVALAATKNVAIMCAEAVWWRCHRRIIVDYLLARGVDVRHIMGPGTPDVATLTPGAQVLPDRTILYVKEPQLL